MKSAYELAMERMGGDGESKPLTDEQKEKIAEVETRYKAKIAERKIFLEKSLSDAIEQHNHEEADTIRRQLADEIARLEDKAEADKEKIRNS
jgi:cysteinyl-tRNA synthetase